MGPPRGRNRSSLWMLRKYVRIGESDIPKRESECIPLDKYMPMHTHKCKKRFFLHTDAHIFMLWLLEMMDDVYEILLHFADLYLPCITSSGNRWRFSYNLAVSWETLKKKKKKRGPTCAAHTDPARKFTVLIIWLNKWQTKRSGAPPVFKDKQTTRVCSHLLIVQ